MRTGFWVTINWLVSPINYNMILGISFQLLLRYTSLRLLLSYGPEGPPDVTPIYTHRSLTAFAHYLAKG